jgi:membrane-associated phospholipid phosphatase
MVGFSRIALGAHFLTDVIAAVFFGILWLAFCVFAMKSIRSRDISTTALPFVGGPALVRVDSADKPAQTLPR